MDINSTDLIVKGITLDQSLGLLGLLLSVVGILTGFGLYFFDFRKRLEEISIKQDRTLAGFNVELSRRIDEILRKQEGVLTKFQADHLTDLYLDAVKSRLNLAIDRYAANDLEKHFKDKREDAIVYELNHAYDMVVRRSIRPMVSPFRLRGDCMFDELVSSVSREEVNRAFDGLKSSLPTALEAHAGPEQLIVAIRQVLLQAGDEGGRLIREKIEKLYSLGNG